MVQTLDGHRGIGRIMDWCWYLERSFCDIIVGLEIRLAGDRRECTVGSVGRGKAEEKA